MSSYGVHEGILVGLALGDALGAPTEFLRYDEIVERYGHTITFPTSGTIRVTDDTQMTIAVGRALNAAQSGTPAAVVAALTTAYIAWLDDPENNRAPGTTCLDACEALRRHAHWVQATVQGSKGCGANMRTAPAAFVEATDRGLPTAPLAQLQAALTHGHPTALAASDLTAETIRYLMTGGPPVTIVAHLERYVTESRTTYWDEWLGDLWQRPGETSPQTFVARGWDECSEALKRLRIALADPPTGDICLATGAGWVAEESLMTGLLAFLLTPDEPMTALQRAAVTSGDSDSIASMTGAFAGAHLGIEAWPTDLVDRLEYREELQSLAHPITLP